VIAQFGSLSQADLIELQTKLYKGGWYCVAPSTRVLTADLRWVPAGEIKETDDLLGFDEYGKKTGEITAHGRTMSTKRHWHRTGVIRAARVLLPAYRLLFDDGTEVVCSGEHRWLAGVGATRFWTTTDALRSTSRVAKLMEPWRELGGWRAGYLAAAFDGEGHVSQARTKAEVAFTQKPNVMLDEVVHCLDHFGFRFTEMAPTKWDGCGYVRLRNKLGMMEFLGSVRPRRLLANFDPEKLGSITPARAVRIVAKESVGEQELVALTTTTGTFVAEGLASHNSDAYYSKHPKQPQYGILDTDSFKAYSDAASFAAQMRPSNMTLDEIITQGAAQAGMAGGGGAGGGGRTRAPLNITLTNPTDITNVVNKTVQQLVGRNATQSEIASITKQFQQAERAAQTSIYNANLEGGTATQAPNLSAFAEQEIRAEQPNEIAGHDIGANFDQLLSILKSPV
jgi:hypothetical protein